MLEEVRGLALTKVMGSAVVMAGTIARGEGVPGAVVVALMPPLRSQPTVLFPFNDGGKSWSYRFTEGEVKCHPIISTF